MERKRAAVLLSLAFVYFALVSVTAYYKRNGLRDMNNISGAIEKVEAEMSAIERENGRLKLELASLKNGDIYVEAVARESLGLVKPGEVVYEFVDAERLASPDEGAARP